MTRLILAWHVSPQILSVFRDLLQSKSVVGHVFPQILLVFRDLLQSKSVVKDSFDTFAWYVFSQMLSVFREGIGISRWNAFECSSSFPANQSDDNNELHWVGGYQGQLGDERADEIATDATVKDIIDYHFNRSCVQLRNEAKRNIILKWQERRDQSQKERWIKIFFGRINLTVVI
ncbi:hypothetical protein AVEN_125685-1, partial [Araneus ventricosus]